MKPRVVNVIFGVILAAAIGAVIARSLYLGRPAEEPAMFHEHLTLRQARERSAETGKPIFLVASATWCGYCQRYTRETLHDQRVQNWITERAIPVHLDVDQFSFDATALNIESIPATILLRADDELDRFTGLRSPEDLLTWLERPRP